MNVYKFIDFSNLEINFVLIVAQNVKEAIAQYPEEFFDVKAIENLGPIFDLKEYRNKKTNTL